MNHNKTPSFGGDVKPSVPCTEKPLSVSFEKSRVFTPDCPNASRDVWICINNLRTDLVHTISCFHEGSDLILVNNTPTLRDVPSDEKRLIIRIRIEYNNRGNRLGSYSFYLVAEMGSPN